MRRSNCGWCVCEGWASHLCTPRSPVGWWSAAAGQCWGSGQTPSQLWAPERSSPTGPGTSAHAWSEGLRSVDRDGGENGNGKGRKRYDIRCDTTQSDTLWYNMTWWYPSICNVPQATYYANVPPITLGGNATGKTPQSQMPDGLGVSAASWGSQRFARQSLPGAFMVQHKSIPHKNLKWEGICRRPIGGAFISISLSPPTSSLWTSGANQTLQSEVSEDERRAFRYQNPDPWSQIHTAWNTIFYAFYARSLWSTYKRCFDLKKSCYCQTSFK